MNQEQGLSKLRLYTAYSAGEKFQNNQRLAGNSTVCPEKDHDPARFQLLIFGFCCPDAFVGYEDTATEQSAGTQSVLLQTDGFVEFKVCQHDTSDR